MLALLVHRLEQDLQHVGDLLELVAAVDEHGAGHPVLVLVHEGKPTARADIEAKAALRLEEDALGLRHRRHVVGHEDESLRGLAQLGPEPAEAHHAARPDLDMAVEKEATSRDDLALRDDRVEVVPVLLLGHEGF